MPHADRFKYLGALQESPRSLALRPVEDAGVHDLSGARYGLEVELVARNLRQHEVAISIEPCRHLWRRFQIVISEFAGIAENKIVGTIFWLDPLINVFVPR